MKIYYIISSYQNRIPVFKYGVLYHIKIKNNDKKYYAEFTLKAEDKINDIWMLWVEENSNDNKVIIVKDFKIIDKNKGD